MSPAGTYQLLEDLAGARARNITAGRIHPSRRALTVRGQADGNNGTEWDDDRPGRRSSSPAAWPAPSAIQPGHRMRPDARQRTGVGVRRPRVTRSRRPASARACRRARLAIHDPCARRTHQEGLPCPNPSAASRLALPALLIALGTATALAVHAGGQLMVAAGPATRRMHVVRVPTRLAVQRGRRRGRRRIQLNADNSSSVLVCTSATSRRPAPRPPSARARTPPWRSPRTAGPSRHGKADHSPHR